MGHPGQNGPGTWWIELDGVASSPNLCTWRLNDLGPVLDQNRRLRQADPDPVDLFTSFLFSSSNPYTHLKPSRNHKLAHTMIPSPDQLPLHTPLPLIVFPCNMEVSHGITWYNDNRNLTKSSISHPLPLFQCQITMATLFARSHPPVTPGS